MKRRNDAGLWGLALCILAGCGTPPAGDIARDTTAPDIFELRASYQRAVDGRQVGSEIIPVAALTRRNIFRDNRIILSAITVDGESGIFGTSLSFAEAEWECHAPGSTVTQRETATLLGLSDEERAGTAYQGLPYIRSAHFTFDLFDGNRLRLVCPSTDDSSEMSVRVIVKTANGKGLSTSSGLLTFVYLPRAVTLPPATSNFCRGITQGQIFACPAEKICAPRRTTVCPDGGY